MPRFEELLREEHLLISEHTMKYLNEEIYLPGPTIDRANRSRWQEEGSRTLGARAAEQVETLVAKHQPVGLSDTVLGDLTSIMETEARRHGMSRLPEIR